MSRLMRDTLLLLASFLCLFARAQQLSSVYVPIGAGEPRGADDELGSFGMFGDAFRTCGKKTVSTLNEQFKTGASAEVEVHCEPSPTRVVVVTKKGGTAHFGDFPRDLKTECELLVCSDTPYEDKGVQLGVFRNVPVVAPQSESPTMAVCGDKKPVYSDNANVVSATLLANEGGGCFKAHAKLKSTLNSPTFSQVPRWLKKGHDRFNLRPYFYAGEKEKETHRLPYAFEAPKQPLPEQKHEECKTACDVGGTVKLTMRAASAYKAIVYLRPTCPSFKICLSPGDFDLPNKQPICHPQQTIDVLVDNGVVVWPNKGRASLIELRSPHTETVVAVEFGYGTGDPANPDAQFYVGNDHREFVTSDSAGFDKTNATRLAFVFANEDCLFPNAGIFSRYIQTGFTWSKTKPSLIGTDYQLSANELVPITKPQLHVPDVIEEGATDDVDVAMPVTTTPAPPRVAVQGVELDASSSALETDNLSEGVFVEGKWWTWGIYIGFIIGTLVTLAIGSGVFWFLRRTIFSYWYRGMYKRYGCDPSGTTAGLTGIGFGTTATGDMTAVGTTATSGSSTMSTVSTATTR